jgi:hypothetical protein
MPKPDAGFLKLLHGLEPAPTLQPGLVCFVLEDLTRVRQFMLWAGVGDVYQTAVTQGRAEIKQYPDKGETTALAPFILNPLPCNSWAATQAFGLLLVFLNDRGRDIDATLLVHLCDDAHQQAAAELCMKALVAFSAGYPLAECSLEMAGRTKGER